jgi:glycosyltransferase involved in cell wall biosynthesis
MKSEDLGGLGEIQNQKLASFEARYRFFFNPIRYTSLGLAVLEAMMVGMPVVGLATTEMVTVIKNGFSGYVDTNVETLIEVMKELIVNPEEAERLGNGARETALERFNIQRFSRDWDDIIRLVAGNSTSEAPTEVASSYAGGRS